MKGNKLCSPQHIVAGEELGAGLSLKPEHLDDILALPVKKPSSHHNLWFEVHTENYFVAGGPRLNYLRAVRENYNLSFHGVGGSLGSDHQAMSAHTKRVKALIDEFQPTLVSEHAVWSKSEGKYFADLMPLPRTQDALQSLINGIDCYQSGIGRSILIENPSNYLDFISDMDEPQFLVEAAKRSGCGLLIDINNLYISSKNTGIDALNYLTQIPADLVGEIHIAGHDPDPALGQSLLIDSHAAAVAPPVWTLLEQALALFGHRPVLVERDANIPAFDELMSERQTAQDYLNQCELKKSLNAPYKELVR
ncbi:MNIO family bufferin maturase [Paraglaciecola polaris]|uniref:Uncharacterized protein n=1 Tax=Paraglaciecola polaris LMG 21857 TaxID=1129793 RepID=K6Z861_9ALTE|nr:DUF692 domain-containing protein [Paraglaciecola polaris]GAC32346.1 hypothetical protein GPLA_1432 [Paraglaciecola polaris LMG 21857]